MAEGEVNKIEGTRSQVAEKYGLRLDNISKIMKAKDKILSSKVCGLNGSLRRVRQSKFPLIEEEIVKWLTVMNSKDIPLTQAVIKSKAMKLAEQLQSTDFKASNVWMEGLCHRNNIVFQKFRGKESDVSEPTLSEEDKEFFH